MSKTKAIISAVLFVLVAGLCIFGVVKLTSIETKSVSPFSFSVGDVDTTTGTYKENKSSIVTKNFIECQGLSIVPKFDSNVDYMVFFYNENEEYLKSTKLYSSQEKCENAVPSIAKYCRIVIYPSQFDEEGDVIEDFKVRFYEPVKYASNLKIKVNKVQKFEPVDIRKTGGYTEKETSLDSSVSRIGHAIIVNENGVIGKTFEQAVSIGISGAYEITKINCSDIKQYKCVFKELPQGSKITVYYFANNKIMQAAVEKTVVVEQDIYLDVPSGAEYIVIVTPNKMNYTKTACDFSLYETKIR
ncbi:MAG: hypothetical protein IJ488_01595 [Clostridia bacterium]|nr:hypothetical protein [Clostridia bacterium]